METHGLFSLTVGFRENRLKLEGEGEGERKRERFVHSLPKFSWLALPSSGPSKIFVFISLYLSVPSSAVRS